MNKIKNNEINLPKKIKKKGGASVMSLRMAGKWARLSRLYLEKHTTSLNYRIKWVNFARRLLKKEKDQGKLTPLERWQIVLTQVLYRLKNQTTDVTWGDGVKQMKNKVINPNAKNR